MNIKSIIKVFAIAFVISVSTNAQTQKVYMPFFEVINMHWQYQYSSSKLLQSYALDNKRYEIVLPPKPDSLYPTIPTAKVQENARSMQAPLYATGELIRVGETVVISFNLYKTENGTLVWSDRLKANTPDDIDPIMKKLANKMGTAEKATKDDDMYNVTNYDGQELNKIQSTNRFGFSLAGAAPLTGFVNKALTGLGIAGSYDSRNLILDIRGMYMFTTSSDASSNQDAAHSWIGSLECYYPLNTRNICPYLGGGFAITSATREIVQDVQYTNYSNYPPTTDTRRDAVSYSQSGLMMMAGGGWILNRNSSVNLRIGGNLFTSFYEIEHKYISGVMLRMEILYR